MKRLLTCLLAVASILAVRRILSPGAATAGAGGNVPADESVAGVGAVPMRVAFPGASPPTAGSRFRDLDASPDPAVVPAVADPGAGLRALAAVPDRHEELVRRLLGWAEGDPQGAAEFALGLEQAGLRSGALTSLLAAWFDRDPGAALTWAVALRESSARDAALVVMGVELARENPMAALELGARMAPSAERTELLAHAAAQWADVDPAGALDWVTRFPPGPERDSLEARLVTVLAGHDPVAAATLVAVDLAGSPRQARAATEVALRWTQQAPVEAANWVVQFGKPEIRDQTLAAILGLWTALDAPASRQWIDGLPPGPGRDAAEAARASTLAAGVAPVDRVNPAGR